MIVEMHNTFWVSFFQKKMNLMLRTTGFDMKYP